MTNLQMAVLFGWLLVLCGVVWLFSTWMGFKEAVKFITSAITIAVVLSFLATLSTYAFQIH